MPIVDPCAQYCLRTLATEENLKVFSDLYEIVDDVTRIRILSKAEGFLFLVDSSFDIGCKKGSYRSDEVGKANATALLAFQLQLIAIISGLASGTGNFYLVQMFDDAARAYFVDSPGSYCQACTFGFRSFIINQFLPAEVNCQTEVDMEQGCRLGYYMLKKGCLFDPNPFGQLVAIAVLNGPGHIHTNRHQGFLGPCSNQFSDRYSIGLHNAKIDDLEEFASKESYTKFLKSDGKTRSIVNKLFYCIRYSCAPEYPDPINDPSFNQSFPYLEATGHFGETLTAKILTRTTSDFPLTGQ